MRTMNSKGLQLGPDDIYEVGTIDGKAPKWKGGLLALACGLALVAQAGVQDGPDVFGGKHYGETYSVYETIIPLDAPEPLSTQPGENDPAPATCSSGQVRSCSMACAAAVGNPYCAVISAICVPPASCVCSYFCGRANGRDWQPHDEMVFNPDGTAE